MLISIARLALSYVLQTAISAASRLLMGPKDHWGYDWSNDMAARVTACSSSESRERGGLLATRRRISL